MPGSTPSLAWVTKKRHGIDGFISGLGMTINFMLRNLVISVPEMILLRVGTQDNKAPKKLLYTTRMATELSSRLDICTGLSSTFYPCMKSQNSRKLL